MQVEYYTFSYDNDNKRKNKIFSNFRSVFLLQFEHFKTVATTNLPSHEWLPVLQ